MTPADSLPMALPAEWRDYFALTKPRVMSLVVFTGLCGLLAAPGYINPVLGFTAVLCIALGAGGAGALNQWWEADIDAQMKRTAKRPLPQGRLRAADARDFGVALSVASVGVMGVAVGWLAAAILAVSILYYAVVYTIWLKPRTPQNIVIGAGPAADRLGRGDWRDHADAGSALRDHLHVDPAAFLGARAVREERLRQGRHSDDARRRGRNRDAQADPRLLGHPLCRQPGAMADRRDGRALRRCRAGAFGPVRRLFAAGSLPPCG